MSLPSSPTIGHQRAHGRAELVIGPAPGGGCVRHLYQSAPLRVLFPDTDPGDPKLGALVNVAGGLAGGDRTEFTLSLKPGACFTATTPAAEKIYRSLGAETEITNALEVEDESVCEWLPQEMILFDGAMLSRRMEMSLAAGARLLAAEMMVFGRAARGERMTRGALHDRWRVRREERLVWVDALRLARPAVALGDRFALGGAGAVATLMLALPDAGRFRERARELAEGGATLVAPGLLLARWMGEAGAVRAALGAAITVLRSEALGLPARLPRLWRS